MTAPFDRWRALYRHRPGQLPTREKLGTLAPETLVTVRADVLLQLVVQAENHEAWGGRMNGEQTGESGKIVSEAEGRANVTRPLAHHFDITEGQDAHARYPRT